MTTKDTLEILKEREQRGIDGPACSAMVQRLLAGAMGAGVVQEDQNLGPIAGGADRLSVAWVDGDLTVEVSVTRHR